MGIVSSTSMSSSAGDGDYVQLQRKLRMGGRFAVNKPNRAGSLPLLAAQRSCDPNIIKLLIQSGADPMAVASASKLDALQSAVRAGNSKMLTAIVKHGHIDLANLDGEYTARLFADALRRGHASIIETLLALGAPPDSGNDPYMMLAAAGRGATTIVRLLLQAGANPARTSPTGTTAMHKAASRDLTTVQILADAGAPIDQPNHSGWTPLFFAAYSGKTDVVEYLLAQGADATRESNYQDSPLHSASAKGYTQIVRALLGAGANPNSATGATGTTPLHSACRFGRVDIAAALLSAGASPCARLKSTQGARPSDLARENHHDRCLALVENPLFQSLKHLCYVRLRFSDKSSDREWARWIVERGYYEPPEVPEQALPGR